MRQPCSSPETTPDCHISPPGIKCCLMTMTAAGRVRAQETANTGECAAGPFLGAGAVLHAVAPLALVLFPCARSARSATALPEQPRCVPVPRNPASPLLITSSAAGGLADFSQLDLTPSGCVVINLPHTKCFEVVLQKSTPQQIRHLVLHYY